VKQRVTVGVVLRSTVHMIGYVLSTLVWGLLSLLVAPLPYMARYWFITRWTHFNLRWFELVCNVRCEVQGVENIPRDRAGVILAKHQSAWETMALQRWFPYQTWVLKRELIRLPVFGWAISLLKPIAIDRSAITKAMRALCEQGTERLKEGIWVVVFPEGTRVAPGERGRYQPGGALLAERAGVPVVPVAHNAGEVWGRNRFLKFPGTIQVRIGPVIETKGKTPTEITRLAEQWIEAQMAEITSPAFRKPEPQRAAD
jgi:1-acyl-sn-glycerol-3-phosphate acyltransferase